MTPQEAALLDRKKLGFLEGLGLIPRSFLRAALGLGADGAITHAAGISYYTILSIFPFLLLIVVVSTRILSDPELSVQAIQWLGSYLPAGREILVDALPVLQRTSGTLGIFSVVGLAWSSMGLFSALRGALDQMMGVKAPPSTILAHWASLVAVVASSFGLLILIGLSTILTIVGHMSLEGVSQTIARFGPVAATVASWLLRPAGMMLQLGTLFVEFLKSGFLWSIQSSGNFTVINGPLAAAIAFMLWAYLTALVLLFGASWAKHMRELRCIAARRRTPDEY